MIHNLTVKDRVVTYPFNDSAVQGNVGVDSLHVEFDSEWSQTTSKSAVFANGDSVVRLAMSGSDVSVPWEVLREPGRLFVTFVGYVGTAKRIVTKVMDRPFRVDPSGVIDGTDPSGPTPDEVQVLIDAVRKATGAAEKATKGANDAAASATSAATAATSAATSATSAATAATSAASSATNAAASANTATGRANSAADEAKAFLNGFEVNYANLSDECKALIAQSAGTGASVISDDQGIGIIDDLAALIVSGRDAGCLTDAQGIGIIDDLFK